MPNDMSPTAASPASSTPTTPSAPTPASPSSEATNSPSPSTSGYDRISNEAPNDPDSSFLQLGGDFDDLIDMPPSTTQPAVEASPPAATASPPVAPAAQVPAPQPPAAPAAPDANAQTPPAAAAPAAPAAPTEVPPADVSTLLEAMNTRAAEILQQVSPQFQLTPEQITELETDAAAAMPKLLANTYLTAVQTAMTAMQQLVPTMIQQTIGRQEAARQMETAFFKQWNQLDPVKHGEDIRQFAQVFAKANPNTTQEQLLSLVGAAVMAKYGLSAAAAPAASPASTPATPAHFTPAVANAPVVHSQPVRDENPFMALGQTFDET